MFHKFKNKLFFAFYSLFSIRKKIGFAAEAGQSLIEVLFIVVLTTAVIAGNVSFLARSYAITEFVAEQTTATYLAAEGIEIVKNLIDANCLRRSAWNDGISEGTYEVDYQSPRLEAFENKFLKFDPTTLFYSYKNYSGEAEDSQYKRVVEIDATKTGKGKDKKDNDAGINVVSKVEWTGRHGKQNVELTSFFYNWRTSEMCSF